MKLLKITLISLFLASLVGCSASTIAIKKRNLDVSSKTSQAIILEPIAPEKRIAYVRVRDVSGSDFDLKDDVIRAVQSKGIHVTDDASAANFMLTATILQAGKTTEQKARLALLSGFSSGALAAGAGALVGYNDRQAAGLGLAGGAAGFLADTLVDDVFYSVVVDVEMRERPLENDTRVAAGSTNNEAPKEKTVSAALPKYVQRSDNHRWIAYQTRVVTTANKVNLTLDQAMPAIKKDLSKILSNMLD